jgi:chromosome partitioning protein
MLHQANQAEASEFPLRDLVDRDAVKLLTRLHDHQAKIFPPVSKKTMRRFQPGEAVNLLGVTDSYLRQIITEGKVILRDQPSSGRRTYSIEDIAEIRSYLDRQPTKTRRYTPSRHDGEGLQIISVMNFKGGSGKTTTAAHLAQYLALHGYRVLALDLDPQASLTTLFGLQPELEVSEGETVYGAIRYDEPRHIGEIIRSTYMAGLHLIPANLELMEFEHDTPKALLDPKPDEAMFFSSLTVALEPVADQYDVVVVDCPPQLGFLTLSALCAATSLIVTIHPQMLDILSMAQFLKMTGDLLEIVGSHGGVSNYDWMRYLVTRYEPGDGPQTQMVGFLRSLFEDRVLTHPMLKSTAISDAGLTKQTLYEVDRGQFTRGTYDRALESLNAVNGEIEALIQSAWGRG